MVFSFFYKITKYIDQSTHFCKFTMHNIVGCFIEKTRENFVSFYVARAYVYIL